MDVNRKRADPLLVCTCSELYLSDIKESVERGCEDPEEIMFDHATQFRCEMCRPILDAMLRKCAR